MASRPASSSSRPNGSGTTRSISTWTVSPRCGPIRRPRAVEEIFRAEFDGAFAEGGLFLLTMHPHIIGHRSRVRLLERLIRHMKAAGKCWFATHRQVAEWCRDQAR